MGKNAVFAVIFFSVLSLSFLSAWAVSAQTPIIDDITRTIFGGQADRGIPGGAAENSIGAKLQNPIAFNSLGELVNAILDVILYIAVPIAALFLIYSGFLFVTARGNDETLKKAKSIFMWTLVGIAVLLGAKVLSEIIKGTIEQIKR